jgi:type II secretory pathway pseudopilin PulG
MGVTRRAGGGGSAFVLIELLVVVAVIAVLAYLLFPVLARAREAARQRTCTSNMRQIGMAFRMYMEDCDGMRPYPLYRLAPRYVTSPAVLVCPSDPTGNYAYDTWGYRLADVRWPIPVSYDFFGPTDKQWAVMEERGPRSGYLIDRCHGEFAKRTTAPSGAAVTWRWGHTLRLNMDGSVVSREIRYNDASLCNTWTLMNYNPGEQIPPDPG